MSLMGNARSPSEARLLALLRIEDQKEQDKKKKEKAEKEQKYITQILNTETFHHGLDKSISKQILSEENY
jgi:hypothetical protein